MRRLVIPAPWYHALRASLYRAAHAVLAWLDRLGWVPACTTMYLGHSFAYPWDSVIGQAIAHGGEWDSILVAIAPALLPMDEPVICEVGSNIGASLLQILRARPRAHVLAFEPSDRFRPFLLRNLRAAGMTGVEVSSLLLGPRQGAARLFTNASSASVTHERYAGHHPRRRQTAVMTTLDEVVRGGPRLDFVKVDTDGFDIQVLRGGEAMLRRDSPALFFELYPALLAVPDADLAWLRSMDYRRLICFTPEGRLAGVTDSAEQCLAWAHAHTYCDILACRAGSPAAGRIDGLLESLRGAGTGP